MLLRIEQDEDATSPRVDFDNLGHMVCFHNRYNLGDEQDEISDKDYNGWEEMAAGIKSLYPGCLILPLYLYDHSGITIKTTPFGCRWDSGQVGFIYMTRETMLAEAPGNPKYVTKKVRDWAEECLKAEVSEYDQYLTGDVWGYIVEDDEGEDLESCWGFFGEEYCRTEGKAVLHSLMEGYWKEFGNIPVDAEDNITEDFKHFEAGTDRMEIWHWFDENYSKGLAALQGVAT